MNTAATAITKELIEKMEGLHGPVLPVRNRHGEAIFRVPSFAEFDRLHSRVNDPTDRLAAMRQLCIDACVWPEQDAFAQMLSRRPGLIAKFANAITAFAGAEDLEEVSKS